MATETNQEPEVKINYAFSKNATDEHKQNCQDVVGVLFNAINTSQLAVVDCVHADDHSKGSTILAALLGAEEGSAILPLCYLIQEGENISESLVPCLKVEAE